MKVGRNDSQKQQTGPERTESRLKGELDYESFQTSSLAMVVSLFSQLIV